MALILHMLNKTCSVTRPAKATSTSTGVTSDTYAAHLSGLSCRIHRMSGQEAVKYGAERDTRLWRVSFESGVNIERRDRIAYTDVNAVARTIEVQQAYDSGESGIIRVCIGEEVT